MLPTHITDAIRHYIPAMVGMTSVERCIEMAELIYDHKPSVVVDIGAFGGVTLISQAFALRENKKGVIYGIDAYELASAVESERRGNIDWWSRAVDFKGIYLKCAEAIFDHRLMDNAILLRARSQSVAHLFSAIDILNIDGCHSEVASVRDVNFYLPRVVPGGWIWMDDCDWIDDNGSTTTAKAQKILESACDLVRSGENGKYKLYRKR